MWLGLVSFVTAEVLKIVLKKEKIFSQAHVSQRVRDQEGVIHPSHGCPVSPLTPRGAAHEL